MRGHVAILNKYAELLREDLEGFVSPEEIAKPAELKEGGVKTIAVNIYERNPKARRECIGHFGCICSVCGFDFEKEFGAIGKGFIHVHHLLDLAAIGKSYKVKPLEDLRPVCPNCHAMLHKSKPAYPIEELKKLLAAQ
jgi:predicted HNH restriction endonuclease